MTDSAKHKVAVMFQGALITVFTGFIMWSSGTLLMVYKNTEVLATKSEFIKDEIVEVKRRLERLESK